MKNNKSLETYYERMRDLSGIQEEKKSQSTNNNVTLVEHKQANDGTILGIVKDAHNYYVKKTTSKDNKLNESHFSFISGLENKNEYKYNTLADAQKHLNIFINSMNENFSKNKKVVESKKQNLSENNEKSTNPDNWIKNMIKEGKKEEEINRYNSFKESMNLNESKSVNEDDEENVDDKLEDTSDALENLDDQIKNSDDEKKDSGEDDESKEEQTPDLSSDDSNSEETNDETPDDKETGGENEETPKKDKDDDLDLDDLDLGDDNEGEESGEEKSDNEDLEKTDDETGESSEEESGEQLDVKELQKTIGKLTHKVRNIDLTPDQAKSFMNSLLSAFESDLSDIDLEDKKEMSNKILKATKEEENGEENEEDVNEGERGPKKGADYRDEKGEVPGEQDTGPHEYEEDVDECDECQTFESYLSDRGYGDIEGVSSMEMANVVSGYIDQKDKLSNKDLFEIAPYCSEEVISELSEYGYTNEIDELQPYVKKLNEDNKMKFGTFQTGFNPDDIDVGDDEENLNENDEEDELSGELDSAETSLDNDTEITDTTQMAPPADTMGVTSPSRNELNVDLKSGEATLTVSEQKERKVRKYIRNRIEEKLGNKKPSINESKKTPKMKKLDNMIDSTLLKLTK